MIGNVSKPFFVDVKEIIPGQMRYSEDNVDEKVKKFVKGGRVIEKKGEFKLAAKTKEGKKIKAALRKNKDALPVVKAPNGYLLIDGHHHLKASLKVGSKKIPIKVIADYSNMSENKFLKVAQKNHWVYTKDLDLEDKELPKNFDELKDDPNRYFAGMAKGKEKKGVVKSKFAAPIWIKDKKTLPFTEFRIADAMYAAGIVYNKNMPKEEVAGFAEAVKDVIRASDDPVLKDLKIVP